YVSFQECKNAAPYRNKCIENWEDICTLFGADRAIGDGSKQHDEAADVMEGEMVSGGRSSSKDPNNSGSRKRKKDSVAEAVNSFPSVWHFKESDYEGSKKVKRYMNSNPDEFLMLKELPEDEKLEWVFLCLAE
ncbi:AP-4 complex subunit mu, partial [Bienertia sinuspersici]